jgi:hypothetical protein
VTELSRPPVELGTYWYVSKGRKCPELHGQNNGKEENAQNCTDKIMEMKEMSGTARTK